MQRFTVMTMVKLDGKNRTVKVVGTKTLPFKKKEPAPQGRTKEAGRRYGDMGAAGLYIDYRRGRPGKGGKAVMGYKTCPYCGAHLDPEEACDCGEEDLAVPQETKEPAGGRRTGSEKETL